MAPAGGEDNLTQIEMLARPGAKNSRTIHPTAAVPPVPHWFPTEQKGVDVGKQS